MMSDKDISSWENRLRAQVLRNWDNYVRRRIHLDGARTSEVWGIAGEFVYIEEVSSASARMRVAISRNTNDQLDLVAGVVIKTVFKELWLWNDAQAGEWIDIIIGINFEYYKRPQSGGGGGAIAAEAQPAFVMTNAAAAANTVGPANVCNRVLLRAHPDNTGRIWLDFGAAVLAVDTCYCLDAGETICVPLSNTNRINAWFTVADELLLGVLVV